MRLSSDTQVKSRSRRRGATRLREEGYLKLMSMLAMKWRDVALVLLAPVLIIALAAVGWLWWGEAALLVAVVLSTMLTLALALEIYRRLSKYALHSMKETHELLASQTDTILRQTEALLSLFSVLKPRVPLPETRGSAIAPDLMKRVAETIYGRRPSLVLEAGSGVSTLFIALCLRAIGHGCVIALEHDPKYLETTLELLQLHGVENFATVVHAPLREIEVRGEQWLWYETKRLPLDQPIDLFLVDGPPGTIGSLARYPALPLLFEHLGHGATIFLDDANRPDEQRVVQRWRQEYGELITCEFVALEKGAYIIGKVSRLAADAPVGGARKWGSVSGAA
jgi:predicted O-methyltransferase YrrM